MNSLRCLIIDDDKWASMTIQILVAGHTNFKHLNSIDNYEDAFSYLNTNNNIDLMKSPETM